MIVEVVVIASRVAVPCLSLRAGLHPALLAVWVVKHHVAVPSAGSRARVPWIAVLLWLGVARARIWIISLSLLLDQQRDQE